VFMPILWMVLLGFALGGSGNENYSLGWDITGSEGSESALVKEALIQNPKIHLKEFDTKALNTLLIRGEVSAIAKLEGNELIFSFDPNNPASRVTKDITNTIAQEALGRKDIIGNKDEIISIPGTRYIDFLIPGLLALSILTSSMFGTGMTIVSNRREGLLKRYLATPMQAPQYLISHVIGRGFILVVEATAILVCAYLIFDFHIIGSFLAFVFFAVLGAAAFTAISIFFGARTENASTMNGISNLFMLPLMLLSGVWFSTDGFPKWLGLIADWLPLKPLVDGLRRVALEGATLADLQFQIGLLVAYTVLAIVAAKSTFKWY